MTHSHGARTRRTSAARCASAPTRATSVLDPVLPRPRRRQPLRRRRLVLPLVGGGQSGADDRRAGAAGRRPHHSDRSQATESARESSIVQSRRHHRVRLQQGRAVLLGRLRLPAGRRRRHAARARARRSSASTRRAGTCKIGWIRVPGGAVLEIFEFQPQQPPQPVVVEPRRPDAHLVQRPQHPEVVRLPGQRRASSASAGRSGRRAATRSSSSRDFDGNLIEMMDLGYMYHVLNWLGRSAAGSSGGGCTSSTTRTDPPCAQGS